MEPVWHEMYITIVSGVYTASPLQNQVEGGCAIYLYNNAFFIRQREEQKKRVSDRVMVRESE